MPTLPPVVARYVEPVTVSCVVVALPFNIKREVVADWPAPGCVHASYPDNGVNPKMEDDAVVLSRPPEPTYVRP